ncbi:MAG: 8-amino-7-oxononanoate synthase, partial [Bacilli bacterium]|nr:8-amino-7-oxononanoate synthase [Bacilli bacterium]
MSNQNVKQWLAQLKTELDEMKARGLYRNLRRIDSLPGPVVQIEGRELIMCSSNNYLGLAGDARLIEASNRAAQEFGTGATGSRLTTGNTRLHERLEKRLAEFKQTEAALLFNTGYMANLAVMTALAAADDLILSDALNHASIVDGTRLSKAQTVVYEHKNNADLETKLQAAKGYRRRLIVTDGVFSMDGDIAPLPELVELSRRYDALLVVDDAHATGVIGPGGSGTAEHFGLHDEVHVQIGTLSKAIGSEGGFVAGDRILIDYLRNKARPFFFSTALAPAVVAAAHQAIDLIEQEPVRRLMLLDLIKLLYYKLQSAGFTLIGGGETAIVSVMLGDSELAVQFSRHLEELGIFAPAIRPP